MSTATAAAPRTLHLTADVELTAASADGTRRPTFEILAYTGAPMRLAGFANGVIIELAGLKPRGPRIPILRDHDNGRVIGQADSITIDRSGVRLAGTITGDDDDARSIVTHSKNGFRWQASIGATIVRQEFLREGEKATVNGRSVAGPMTIVRQASLFETSFVAVGADGDTETNIAARRGTMSTSTETAELTAAPTAADPEAIRAAAMERSKAADRLVESFDGKPGDGYRFALHCMNSGADPQTVELAMMRHERTVSAPGITVRGGGLSNQEQFEAYMTNPPAPRALARGPSGYGRDLGTATLEASLLLRSGRDDLAVRAYGERTVHAASAMRHGSLVDLCGAVLRHEHRDPAGMSRSEMIQAAFSTLSLPTTLSNVMGKVLWDSYMESTGSWRGFARVLSAADFKPQTGIRPSFVGELEQLAPTGEIKHGTLAESTFPWSVDTYAKIFTVDRQTVVNDDLGFIDQTPVLMAKAAARKLNDLVWGTILGNAGSFFHTSNNNLLTGAGSALDYDAFGAAIAAMRTQRGDQDEDLQIIPRVLAAPPEQEATARSIVTSSATTSPYDETAGTANVWRGLVDVVIEPRLSNTAKFANASTTAWYVFAGAMDAPVIVGFLEGRQNPTIEVFPMGHVPHQLSMTFRCFHDFGSALGDSRAAVKNAGA